ncbi:MAG: S8 family serine peptidase [Moorea sp. SIO2B7]|nr:S8 family serine peptidase [Moorena sp. SIO2B7]
MSNPDQCYTYHAGNKINLIKRSDQFVVRAIPEKLKEIGISDAQQVSSASSRVTCRKVDLESLMSQTRNLAPSYHDYRLGETGEEFLITDRIFVTFKDSLTSEQVDTFAGSYGLIQKQAFSDRDYLFKLTKHTGINPVKLVVKLTEEDPLVEIAEHDLNYKAQVYQLPIPTDPFYLQQWHLHKRSTHPDVDPRSSSECEAAWELLGGYGSSDVVIGVTDDGCKLDHQDFNSPGKLAGWGYFIGERLVTNADIDANPAQMHQIGANHGTSCAGVIAAELDAVLTVGAAPGCRLLPIKWESSGPSLFISPSKVLTAINYAADKVDILSNSWGGVPNNFWPSYVTRRIAELAQTGGRRGRGIIFLWAAGNSNCPINYTGSIDIPYTMGWEFENGSWVWANPQTSRSFRSDLVGIPGVMYIAALASNARRSHYSNYGPGVTLCAPSSNGHTYFRVQVAGLGITTTTGPEHSSNEPTSNEFGGTSSATPLVAGIAALTISANPELSALEVISILKQTASKDLNFTTYPKTPPANYDPNPSWDVSPVPPFDKGDFTNTGDPDGSWSPWFGHGKVDARAAVAEAQKRRQTPPPTSNNKYTSKPAKSIPDNYPKGIKDVISISDSGILGKIRVSLDISHSWIGDLIVELTAPNGTKILLHNRSGSSQDNIQKTYDSQDVPALASLINSNISGDWTLRVMDLAASDTGMLQSWGLEIDLLSERVVAEDTEAVQIPDNNPTGITRTLNLPAGNTINDLAVSLDITHPYIGDLRVILTPPNSTPITLHDRVGGGADNIVRTWQTQDLPGLQALRGRDAGGNWQLQVADLAGQDVGKLNRWKIEVF